MSCKRIGMNVWNGSEISIKAILTCAKCLSEVLLWSWTKPANRPCCVQFERLVDFGGPNRQRFAMVRISTQLVQRVQILVLLVHWKRAKQTRSFAVVNPLDFQHFKDTASNNLVHSAQDLPWKGSFQLFGDWSSLNHQPEQIHIIAFGENQAVSWLIVVLFNILARSLPNLSQSRQWGWLLHNHWLWLLQRGRIKTAKLTTSVLIVHWLALWLILEILSGFLNLIFGNKVGIKGAQFGEFLRLRSWGSLNSRRCGRLRNCAC